MEPFRLVRTYHHRRRARVFLFWRTEDAQEDAAGQLGQGQDWGDAQRQWHFNTGWELPGSTFVRPVGSPEKLK